jgi:hypothetical protein
VGASAPFSLNAMTTINTLAPPDDKKYVRIFPCSIEPNKFVRNNLNRVAKVTALPETVEGDLGHDLIFIEMDGDPKCLDRKDTEYITEKEYFEGILKHG